MSGSSISNQTRTEDTKSLPTQKALPSEGWRVALSSFTGYQNNYSLAFKNGDFLNLDFSPTRKMAHISLCLASEQGREYTATIKNGYVIQERERISRSPADLGLHLEPFTELFAQIPAPSLLRVIGGNFGIPKILAKNNPHNLRIYNLYLSRNPWQLLKGYLEKRRAKEAKACSMLKRLWQRLPQEACDLGLGAFVLYILGLKGYLGFAELACLSGFYGIFSGAFDWLWRQRSPFIPKVAFFMGVSILLIYWQVQYRMWAIHL